MKLSVLICTHNPRVDYFAQTIDALRSQSLPREQWEFIVIDNASQPAAIDTSAASWHPNGRVVAEPALGLTNARLRGIAEARGELLVFVDDDNVLAPDYLASAAAIADAHPFLGAFGGNTTGRFEMPPAVWAQPYLQYLAIVAVNRTAWSNESPYNPCSPCGAGMCIRRHVAIAYASTAREDPARRALGRIGEALGACEDTDMALTSCDLGLGVGLFPKLRLDHLISARRVQLDYLRALVRGIHRSRVILEALRGQPPQAIRSGRMERALKFYQRLHLGRETRLLDEAIDEGRRAGTEFAQRHGLGTVRLKDPLRASA